MASPQSEIRQDPAPEFVLPIGKLEKDLKDIALTGPQIVADSQGGIRRFKSKKDRMLTAREELEVSGP